MPKTLATPGAGVHHHQMSDALPKTEPEAGYRVPAHGHGRLRPIQPGQVLNPGGLGGKYNEIIRMCRKVSPEVMARLIRIALDPNEESRYVIVASQEILNRGFGRAREVLPDAGAPELNLESVSEEKLGLIIKTLEAARAAKRAEAEAADRACGEAQAPLE